MPEGSQAFDACCVRVQFSDLNKKEQLAKLAEARTAASLPGSNKYKFVSAVNEQVLPACTDHAWCCTSPSGHGCMRLAPATDSWPVLTRKASHGQGTAKLLLPPLLDPMDVVCCRASLRASTCPWNLERM